MKRHTCGIASTLAVVLLAGQYCMAAVTIVAHYGMGEGEELFVGLGGTSTGLFDSVGPSQDMTLVGTSIPIGSDAAPVLGSSRSMDFASVDYYSRSTNILGNISNNYLFEAWVKPASTTTATSNDIIFADGHGGVGKVVFQNGSAYGIGIGGVTFTTGAAGIVTPGVWQHLALVRDSGFNGGATTLLVNGAIYHATGAAAGSANSAGVGNQGAGGFEWDGKVDELYYATTSGFTTADLHMTSNIVFDNQFNTTWDIDNDGNGTFDSNAATYTPSTAGVSQFAQHGSGQVWLVDTLTPQPWSVGGVIFTGGANTTGEISTSFNTIAGLPYRVMWDVDLSGNPTTTSLIASIDGTAVSQVLGTTDPDGAFEFIGAGGPMTLRIGINAVGANGSSDVYLDYVTVAQLPTPAAGPAGLGLMTLGALRRRRN